MTGLVALAWLTHAAAVVLVTVSVAALIVVSEQLAGIAWFGIAAGLTVRLFTGALLDHLSREEFQ